MYVEVWKNDPFLYTCNFYTRNTFVHVPEAPVLNHLHLVHITLASYSLCCCSLRSATHGDFLCFCTYYHNAVKIIIGCGTSYSE
jgi:hypothetical protein